MNCDPLARWYRWLEYLGMGRALERRRFEFLPEFAARGQGEQILVGNGLGQAEQRAGESVAEGHGQLGEPSLPYSDEPLRGSGGLRSKGRALVLGDGDGRFLARFLAVQPGMQVDYVDSSAKMLALARKRAEKKSGAKQTRERVVFHHADARGWLPAKDNRYKFVFTHFFLDCLTGQEVDELVGRLVAFTTCEVAWIVSEFHQPENGFAAWRAMVWIGGLYRLFGLATGLQVRRLPGHRHSLRAHGFELQREVQAELGLLVSEWWQRRR